ncbi:metallo-peptidase, Clan ME, Family M16, putative [Trypanosoma brucei gambiense DAL972]|uniref:Peptidase, putative n=1 Tax=Trypanosoma brucei gambiense (strain MHOM/CI/86/DAL972) TaxID=679716 RepID=C9ZWJ2_TRYB9|nr:metallo-peptidase, Clan ME, Family M16, putative [Trypanosoma brucei gambiense DAL972]CBH13781.1 metallo-peptidase, Clan ME, Family M16, putative [Trypanosoma brucei gambiense DAL972]|eukprot:XP_011776057.1 metallo-peptidase, Clan ME, Family M16, putative [Trypanosoma brucei gambiense DAL972]
MTREEVRIVTPSVLRVQHFGYIFKNGVKCIVVQDPNARVPAAAMNIRAGQLNDPEVLPGLAHFCEHMLFMGTEKYPSEGEYSDYITKNGGYCNAWTADRGTTYYFTVAQDALQGALERFVEFFIAPSFDASSISREVKAVHSEDEKNHSVDFWRQDELLRSLCDPRHPRSRYGNGNMTTLWDEPLQKQVDIREQLLKFFEAHYVSGAACIAVYSAFPPEWVLSIIEEPLSKMRVGEPSPFRFMQPSDPLLRSTASGGLWLNVRTVRKTRSIAMIWPVKSHSSLWRSSPSGYVSYILGHECDSSVFGILRQQGLAVAMSVGPRRIDDDNELFCVDISLTLDGVRCIPDVIDMVYQGIGQTAHVDTSVYEHMKSEELLSFESCDISGYADHCVELAYSANETDLPNCWVSGNRVLEDDIHATEEYVAQLTPEKCVITFMWGDMPCSTDDDTPREEGPESAIEEEEEDAEESEEEQCASSVFHTLPNFAQIPCNCATRFHKTKFSLCRVPDDLLRRWAASLHKPTQAGLSLPPPNPFLATDFTLYNEGSSDGHSEPAVETFNTMYGVTLMRKNVWHYQTFKSSIHWCALSPCVYATPKNRFYARVMRSILKDALAEVSYFGVLASLENSVELSTGGISLSVTGPQQRIVEFFFSLFEKFFSPNVLRGTAEKYNTYSEVALRHLVGSAAKQPYELVNDAFVKVGKVVMYTFDEILNAASSISYKEYLSFVDDYLRSGIYFECFIAGNIPSASYMRECLLDTMEKKLSCMNVPPAPKESIPRFRDAYAFSRDSSKLGTPVVSVMSYPPFNPENPNVAVLLDIYVGEETAMVRALCDCMNKLLSSSFFNELRTKEALGYIVFSRSLRLQGTAHLQFGVQSAVEGVDGLYLFSRIIAFLAAVEEKLVAVCSETDVQTVVSGLIEARKKLPDSADHDCDDLSGRYLNPLGIQGKEAVVAALEQVSPQMVREFFQTYVANSNPHRKAVLTIVNSSASAATDAFNTDQEEVALPSRRPCEGAQPIDGDDVAAANRGCVLNLPDFTAVPMRIAIKRYGSPQEFQANLPVIRCRTF